MPKRTANQSFAATALAKKLLEDKEYQSNLIIRLRAGALPPAVESMLWHYAFGKPVESVEVSHTFMDDLEQLSDAELDVLERELEALPVSETVN